MLRTTWKSAFFMFFAFTLFLSASVVIPDGAGGLTWDVFPEMDRTSIQAVVDSAADGDTILFHAGLYDWTGAPLVGRADNSGAINISDKTLTIRGEEGTLIMGPQSVNPLATNAMGVNAFFIADLDQNNDVTFANLTLQSFLRGFSCSYTAATYPADVSSPNLRNLTIVDCNLWDIHRDAISISEIGGNVLIRNNVLNAARTVIYVSWYWSVGHAAWQPDDTFIRIFENGISGSAGILLYQTTNVRMQDNTISTTSAGITIVDTRNGAVVSGNAVENPVQGIYVGASLGGGEAVGAVIEKNKLKNITGYGISMLGGSGNHGNVIRGNEIQTAPRSYAGLYTFGHNNYFGQNRITGSGNYAVCLQATISLGTIAHHETMHANNVDQFSPVYSHFYLRSGTHDNLIVGSGMDHNTYYDYGYNNRITGVTPLAGGIGGQLSEAIGLKNEELKEAKSIVF